MTPSLQNQLVAPKFAELTSPNAPEIVNKRSPLLEMFVLNCHLSLFISNMMRQLVFNFIRKSESSFEEYSEAVADLQRCVTAGHEVNNIRAYFSAVRHFEQCLSHLNEATVCLNSLGKQFGEAKQWEPGDGSILERVNTLHNRVKHFDEKLEKGTFPNEMSFKLFATRPDGSGHFSYTDADISNTPFWLTNAGIESRDASLTFAELADEVLSFYKQAEDLAVMQRHPSDVVSEDTR